MRIIPEVRSNSLFISGNEEDVNQVMEALKVLDSAEQPESLKDRVPRMIPVDYADVNDVAEIVKDVYKEHMDGGQQANNRQNQPQGAFNPMAMFMGGQQQQQQQPGGRNARSVQLSIGVDTRTNRLVVSASDSLFRQVESLVQALDESANQARRTMRVVSLQNANSAVVQQTLGSLMTKVRSNSPARTTRGPGNANPPANATNPAATGTQTPANTPATDNSDSNTAAQLLQQQMMFRMFQGGGGGGFGGGGRGGGGGGRGGGGGGRGGNNWRTVRVAAGRGNQT